MGLHILGFHVKGPKVYEGEDDRWQGLFRSFVGEMFGVALFVFLGTGSVYSATEFLHGAQGNIDSLIILVAMAHGFAITLTIYTIGDVSGGHINPAVTWALALTRKISLLRAVLYWIAQVTGAIVASAILKSLIPQETLEAVPISSLLGCHGINPKMSPIQGFWFEIVLTFIFVFVVFGTAISPFVGKMAPVSGGGDNYGPGKLTPLALGLTILTLHLVGVPFTGASMNPARSFGPAVVGGCWENHWIYWAGPLVGSTFSALIAHTLFLSNPSQIAKSFASLRGNKELANIQHHKSHKDDPEKYAPVEAEVEMDN